MKKGKHITSIKKIIKINIKLIIVLILELFIITGTVYAEIKMASSNVYYDKTTSGLTSSNVQDAIDELKTKANSCSDNSSLKVGDYFTLVPDASTYTIATTATGYDSVQTITPNELTLWRVINVNDNGTYDAVSEYTSSTDVYFTGTTGYQKLVGTLQTIATSYAKSGYTTGTRMVGYDGQTLTLSSTAAFDGTSNAVPSLDGTPEPTTGTGQNYTKYSTGDLGDTLYLKDYQLLTNTYVRDTLPVGDGILFQGTCVAYKQGTTTSSAYWLASRSYGLYTPYGSSDPCFFFAGRIINNNGNLDSGAYFSNTTFRTYYVANTNWASYSFGNALRPIITLRSDVSISGGHGIKSDPYIFS